jgi:hypothetical protein
MTARLTSLTFDANDPLGLATFWANALEWSIDEKGHDWVVAVAADGTRFNFDFVRVPQPKTAKNPLHLDLVSESATHQREVVDRLLALGAQRADVGQSPDADHVVLTDPEGNEFCIVLRGEFLANTGFLGAIVFEPANPATGRFWGAAIDWPVVYDEDGDVAIRAPDGHGPFITFGPPGIAKDGKSRLHLDIAPPVGGDQTTEVDRLLALGAHHLDIGQGDVPWVVMADPDGNEFCVLSPQ